MSGAEWDWRDATSGSPRLQRIADDATFNAKQQAYRKFLDHSIGCAGCGHGERRCEKATELWRAYQAADGS